MAISDITVNGHTYTDADWRANWEGTISAIANDIAAAIAGAALVGGTLFKAISGNTTLSAGESDNRIFVFSGTLAAAAAVTFAASFEGLALIVNDTTGGFSITAGLASGATVTVAAGQTALVYCDGTDFMNTVGVISTTTGAAVSGTLSVSGNTTISGAATVTGALTLSGDIDSAGDFDFEGDGHIHGGFEVFGTSAFHGDINIEGDVASSGAFSTDTLLAASGCTVNGLFRVFQAATATGEVRSGLSAPSGQSSWWQAETGGIGVWLFGKNNDAQSGANSGANFDIVAQSDGGTPLGIAFRVYRDTQEVNLPSLPTSASGLRTGSLWNNAGVLNVA